jgi:hypothetical protein
LNKVEAAVLVSERVTASLAIGLRQQPENADHQQFRVSAVFEREQNKGRATAAARPEKR